MGLIGADSPCRMAPPSSAQESSAPAASQEPLDQPLGDLTWGATHEEVLVQQEEILLDAYRLAIAGENDPLEIDRQRRAADGFVDAIRSSYREFPDARTGFEVSVVGDELVGARGQAMLMARGDSDTRYFHPGLQQRIWLPLAGLSLHGRSPGQASACRQAIPERDMAAAPGSRM